MTNETNNKMTKQNLTNNKITNGNLEEKLNESKKLFGNFEEESQDDHCHDRLDFHKIDYQTYYGIKALYLQNEVIIDYLKELYKNQSEVKQ